MTRRHGPSVALLEPVSQHSQGQPFLRVLVSRQLLKQPNPLQHRRAQVPVAVPRLHGPARNEISL